MTAHDCFRRARREVLELQGKGITHVRRRYADLHGLVPDDPDDYEKIKRAGEKAKLIARIAEKLQADCAARAREERNSGR